jgi:hypothetical protein
VTEAGRKVIDYRRLVIITWVIVVIAMLAQIDREMTPINFAGQHEEKLTIWTGRSEYLGPPNTVFDFEPPSTVFGWAGPHMNRLGFEVFGLNNYGLRLPFLPFSAGMLLLLGLTLTRIAPGPLGFILFLFEALNVAYISQARSAVLENISQFSLVALVWAWTRSPEIYQRRASWITAACVALQIVKPNFVLYAASLHLCLVAIAPGSIKSALRQAAIGFLFLPVWLGVHLVLLQKEGVLEIYRHNLFRAVEQHLGLTKEMADPTLLNLQPMGFIDTAALQAIWWVDRYLASSPSLEWTFFQALGMMVVCVALIGVVVRTVRSRPFDSIPDLVWALATCMLVNLFVASNLYFSQKRSYPFAPLALVTASLLAQALCQAKWRGWSIRPVMVVGLVAVNLVRMNAQAAMVANAGPDLYSDDVAVNSARLDEILPADAAVYIHCLAFRFLWQSHHRMLSWDDQLRDNQMILNEALGAKATHVVLLDPFTTPKEYRGRFRTPPGVWLEVLDILPFAGSASVYPINAVVFKIHSDSGPDAMVGP